MSLSAIKTVGVIGTGVIGSSWIALFLSKGLRVIVTDPNPEAPEKLSKFLADVWPSLERNGPERLEFKRKLFARLDQRTPADTVICSSSSGIPSSQFISECQRHPERILIGHPFNPPHVVPLVEVVPHPGTEPKHVMKAMEFYRSLGREPVLVAEECPGFVGNRLQGALLCEAYSLVSRGVISASDLDLVMTSALGLRWALTGPLTTNSLGAGGSFHALLKHLGPAMVEWREDMDKHRFNFKANEVASLVERVEKLEETLDVRDLQRKRDAALIELLKMKAQAGFH
ncbi:uncharacterized protein CDV56_109035 [Aspergillus thermomutatus]|uniref:3-hydroxyacyl-CoA dehydrogenase NAD binding domain-containing protein n=1 Tax=Aspergillus thermomutatus TaxID=41047 RepID=A0A397HMR9_ASPTH|nr:uncharacterized protein CDV56_109035 [Aspergillus thermomutatus]RHZ62483.1 hypothetical protein CDV56_109035 [Aspergillus thermomutatus]